MAKKTAPLLPATEELLRQLGDRLRLARLRRRLTAKHLAQRAGMTVMTLRSLEHGGSGVTMGAYLAVMQVLGVERDLDVLASADPLGRSLQDAQLPKRVPLALLPSLQSLPRPAKRAQSEGIFHHDKQPVLDASWIEEGGFASADALLGLIDPLAASPQKKG